MITRSPKSREKGGVLFPVNLAVVQDVRLSRTVSRVPDYNKSPTLHSPAAMMMVMAMVFVMVLVMAMVMVLVMVLVMVMVTWCW